MPSELIATYRVQLHAGFSFYDVAAIADYLAELGISHVYTSPRFQASPGSTHGYDVVDHHRVNHELGGADGHLRFCKALSGHRLGQVLDVVPNHMSADSGSNRWWRDLLKAGPASRYASYFDIYWDSCDGPRPRILLPALGDHLSRVIKTSELRLRRHGGGITLCYHDRAWPLSLSSLTGLLDRAARQSGSDRLSSVVDRLRRLSVAVAKVAKKGTGALEDVDAQLAALCEEDPEAAAAIDGVLDETNADPRTLGALLREQHYRLAYWRIAQERVGYRRFFDVEGLVGLRIEDERVFADTHKVPLQWLSEGILDGLRIDHLDGLRDPEGYLHRLRGAAPRAWLVVEKVLANEECLPVSWPIAGTTGYDFLNRVGGLFVDPSGEEPLTRFYAEFTGESTDYSLLVRQKKHLVMEEALGGDVNRLADLFVRICERHGFDCTRSELSGVLREVIACFPVYRTYVRSDPKQVSRDDARYVVQAIKTARMGLSGICPGVLDLLRDVLLLHVEGEIETDFALTFQQVTGAVMAKGAEDTAFYCFNRLVSLNEVGGDPAHFGVSAEEFHRFCSLMQKRWSLSMLTTSTHDTKRGEDVRLRISLLSEMPRQWAEAVRQWSQMNDRYRTNGLPDRNTEYFFYQTLVGAWPLSAERAVTYMEKASREAKTHTSWRNPNKAYEVALRSFVESVLNDTAFSADLTAFVAPLLAPARVASLAQTLVKLTAPGIPDIYQGTELWDLSLVDPDNRRPVDYQLRRRLLAELSLMTPEQVLRRSEEGLPKLWLILRTLNFRRAHADMFGPLQPYSPVWASGDKAAHVVAFARGLGVVTVVPRLLLGVGDDWGNTTVRLPRGSWHNALVGDDELGGEVGVSRLLARFPVALLSSPE